MSKGLTKSLKSRGVPGNQFGLTKKRIRLKDFSITTTGATGVGFGAAVPGDFPEGNIYLLGSVAYLQFTKQTGGTIATWDGNYSLGSDPTADATLAATEVNIIPSTALAAATAGVSPTPRAVGTTPVMLDNTDGTLEINLNMNVSDASVSADNQVFLVNGVIELLYIVMLDD